MTDEEWHKTTIHLRPNQAKVVLKLYPQKLSHLVRLIIDDLIQDANIDNLSPEIKKEVMCAREAAVECKEYMERKTLLKNDFFKYLDKQQFPLYFAQFGKRKAKKTGREYAIGYRLEGNVLPQCYVNEFINEYLIAAEASGKVMEVWTSAQENVVEKEKEASSP